MFVDFMRDKARQMPTVANPLAVESLRIWHCSYKTLDSITTFQNLRTLVIATFPDLSLEPIGTLAKLAHLETLSLKVLPSWDASRKKTIVNSLEPLAQMPNLKHLSLCSVVPVDRSLTPLERCGSLVTALILGYPREETDRFFAASGMRKAHNPPLRLNDTVLQATAG